MGPHEKPAPAATGGGLENNQHTDDLTRDHVLLQDKITITSENNVIIGYAVVRGDGYDVVTRSMRNLGRVNTLDACVILLMEASHA